MRRREDGQECLDICSEERPLRARRREEVGLEHGCGSEVGLEHAVQIGPWPLEGNQIVRILLELCHLLIRLKWLEIQRETPKDKSTV